MKRWAENKEASVVTTNKNNVSRQLNTFGPIPWHSLFPCHFVGFHSNFKGFTTCSCLSPQFTHYHMQPVRNTNGSFN